MWIITVNCDWNVSWYKYRIHSFTEVCQRLLYPAARARIESADAFIPIRQIEDNPASRSYLTYLVIRFSVRLITRQWYTGNSTLKIEQWYFAMRDEVVLLFLIWMTQRETIWIGRKREEKFELELENRNMWQWQMISWWNQMVVFADRYRNILCTFISSLLSKLFYGYSNVKASESLRKLYMEIAFKV